MQIGLNISYDHFVGQGWNKGRVGSTNARDVGEYLIDDGLYINSDQLKKKLFKSGIKKRICEKCLLVEWNGEPAPLELHHVDGNKRNNRLENLQILCSNCHSQTSTFSRKKLS